MAEKTTPRLKTKYTEEVRPALLKEFQHGNVMEVGRVVKVVVNMGVGEAAVCPRSSSTATATTPSV